MALNNFNAEVKMVTILLWPFSDIEAGKF